MGHAGRCRTDRVPAVALGMSLTGDTTERLVFFLHGGGKNGKSVTLKVIRGILGDYALRVQSKLFEATEVQAVVPVLPAPRSPN